MNERVQSDVNKRAAMLTDTSELIARFCNGGRLFGGFDHNDAEDFADNRTALLASVGLTIAAQLARIADALEAERGE